MTLTERTIAILSDLVAFDTTSRNSNLALIAHVEDYLAGHGVVSERVYDDTGAKANLIATIGPADVPGYILSGHTDVVPVDGQDWATDPFSLTRSGGRLYGRGTCDMKGFLACVLVLVPEMTAAPLKKPLHIAFSYDEEVGCVGVRGLIARLNETGLAPEACFVGEPTSMGVVVGHKGKISLIAEVTGKGCHSSLAPQGVNAVDYGARLVVFIRAIADRLAREGGRDCLYDVPHSTGHTGVFRAGTVLNIVPDAATIEFEFRTIHGESAADLADEVRAFARDVLEPEMKAVDPAAGIRFLPRSEFPGLETPTDAAVVTLAKRLSGRNAHAKVAFGTEAGLFVERMGVPTVVIGPGDIAQAHKPDEFVAIEELERCNAFLRALIAHAAT